MSKVWALIVVTLLMSLSCTSASLPPKVVSTVPANGDHAVDPSLTTLSVTFSKPMMDGNWSWAYTTKETFPQTTGQPYYEANDTTNVLPVKLEPNTTYEVWVNSARFQNFKDKDGNPSEPYKLVFTTKGRG